MQIELYKYQQKFYENIWYKLFTENVPHLCAVLATGGGKSVVIGKLANELPGRTLVLTHRVEILEQNSKWIKNVGLLGSKINTIKYDNDVVIAMVQTLYARIEKYGIEYLGQFDNIILDEVQVQIFEKVFVQYDYKRLIGFTATPCIYGKKIYTTIDDVEYYEPYTLSVLFDDIVQGPDTQDLIDLGYLVQDYNIVLQLPDFDKLKESDSSPDGYTSKSLDEVYRNTASLKILTEAYTKHCAGKKTLIFNASTKINEFVYKHFKSLGLNVKMFDSVNKAEINPKTGNKFTRAEIIQWFKDEKDAILINTNVFTTGFDVTDVEVVVVNRATKSLSLWIQMVGRGSRITELIYKDKFTVIDLGQNISEHGMWSMRRDWKQWFYSPGLKLRNQIDLLSTWECEYCGGLNVKGTIICTECNAEKLTAVINGKTKKEKVGNLEVIQDMPPPKAQSIIRYTKAVGEDANFAFKLLSEKIVELFTHYKVTQQFYNRRKFDYRDSKGVMKPGFQTRVRRIFTPIYFAIIKDNELRSGSNRRLETEFNRVISKIEKLYE